MASKKVAGQYAGNKVRTLQRKANKLYQEITVTIQYINESVESFYQTSSKYVKVLKQIEEEMQKPIK